MATKSNDGSRIIGIAPTSQIIDAPADTGTDTGTGIDPESLSGGSEPSGNDYARDEHGNVKRNADGSPTRKRGRKPGSGAGKSTGKTSTKSNTDLKGLEKILVSMHMMAAGFSKTPEMMLDQQEAALLANAINQVQEHYAFEASAEVMLWTNVIGVLAAIYGPRIVAVAGRKSKEKKVKKQEQKQQAEIISQTTEGIYTPHAPPQ